jgi:hypothetical protein
MEGPTGPIRPSSSPGTTSAASTITYLLPWSTSSGSGREFPCSSSPPGAKPGHVSHTTYEFSSFLAFVERLHDLPPLTARDRRANDLFDVFDFDQEPLQPLVLEERPEVEGAHPLRCRL